MRAVRDMQRLRLFPVVFCVPPALREALGDDYGAPCSAVLAEAAELMESWQFEVCLDKLSATHFVQGRTACLRSAAPHKTISSYRIVSWLRKHGKELRS